MAKRDRYYIEKPLAEEISAFLFALGNQFFTIRNGEAAFDCFKYCVDLNPKNQDAVHNLGVLYTSMNNFEGAYKMFKEAVRMRPESSSSRVALATTARKLSYLDEASSILDDVLAKNPNEKNAILEMAVLCYDMGRLAEARNWNRKAQSFDPANPYMLLNDALLEMTYGRWKEYWSQYEFALSYNKNERMKQFKMSDAWAGQEMPGATLLVISDQGSGDAIQFSRYLIEAKLRGKFAKLIYVVQPDLKSVFSRVEGVDEVVGFEEKMHLHYDSFSALLGVMRVLSVGPEDCRRPPHISTDPRLDAVWKHRIDSVSNGKMRVALAWAGDPKHGNDHARSIPLIKFHRMIQECFNAQFFAFQVGSAMRQLKQLETLESPIINLAEDFRNFDDTASALKQMDLLISVDTSIVHLAGCMGIPCWALIPNPSEFRWLLSAADSPWYDCVRLFRQEKPRTWDPVLDSVMEELLEVSEATNNVVVAH